MNLLFVFGFVVVCASSAADVVETQIIGEEEEDRMILDVFAKASYFSPYEPIWFFQWRTSKLEGIHPNLFDQTDPHVNSVSDMFQTLTIAFFRNTEGLATILRSVQDEEEAEPLTRALIVMKIMSDLGLIVGDRATGRGFDFVADGLRRAPVHTNEAHAMTFQMTLPRCRPAWESIKSIAAEHQMPATRLLQLVGTVGAELGTRWFFRTMGLTLFGSSSGESESEAVVV